MSQTMLTSPIWNTDLIKRYDRSGPRYTSYPTAPHFQTGFDFDQYLEFLEAQAETDAPISLYFHIPFCAHVCYYCACNKVVTKDYSKAEPYLDTLKREIDFYSQRAGHRPVKQLHFGGGTPTFFSAEQLSELMHYIDSRFLLMQDGDQDYSIEIDPREVDFEKLQTLRAAGFNRVSLGVQDLDHRVQVAVNRVQSQELTEQVYRWCLELGFQSINMDLIYGLPFQSVDSFDNTLDAVIELKPARLSVFNYAHLPHRFMPQRRIKSEDLPNPDQKLVMLEHSIKKLLAAGYRNIGMDHFALPNDSLSRAQDAGELHRNFQGYTTYGNCDLIAMGVSAISQVGPYYAQNSADLTEYTNRVAAQQYASKRGFKMSQDDQIRAALIKYLICNFELDIRSFERIYSISFSQYFRVALEKLKPMVVDELLTLDDSHLRVTEKGRLLIRNICMVFDAYLANTIEVTYSKVI